jgi:hypothetical protein
MLRKFIRTINFINIDVHTKDVIIKLTYGAWNLSFRLKNEKYYRRKITPDLNPIENIWGMMMKIKISEENPTNMEEFKNVVMRVWDEIDAVKYKNFIYSMPNRIDLCIARGGRTKDNQVLIPSIPSSLIIFINVCVINI